MSCRFALVLLGVVTLGCARGVSEPGPDFGFAPSPVKNDDPEAGLSVRDGATRADAAPDLGMADAGIKIPVDAGPACGDRLCQSSETCTSCAADCGVCPAGYCGDGTCQALETCTACAVDCGSCGGLGGADCGSCSLLTFERESDCIGNTLFRCHQQGCLISQACGTRTCTRAADKASCQ